MTSSAPPPAHRFVPDGFDASDVPALEERFTALLARSLTTVEELRGWLTDESELISCFLAERARRYIDKTCHTDSEQARDRYLEIERDVAPRFKVLKDECDQHLLASEALAQAGPRYAVLVRNRRAAREIFREENTALEAQEAELQTRQQELMGSLVVQFRGREHTPQQMAPYLEKPDRDLRRDAFMAILETRRSAWPALEDILDQLLELRQRIAHNAGFDSYTPYRFVELGRFDYGPDTCLEFHDAIEKTVVPAVQRLNHKRCRKLGVERLRPWDMEVDPDGAPPLEPFSTEPQLIELVSKTLGHVDPRFASEFAILRDKKMLDLMSRKGKAPGGYQYTIEDVRLPFIFANAVGTHADVQTMLHEAGHAIHAILGRDEPLIDYRSAPIEFAETASMGMELMALEELAAEYGAGDARRARTTHLETVLRILPWIASIDAFQHWLYANPGHDRDARREQWLRIRARFAPGTDYSGIEDALAYQWTSQSHIYNHAFYYVEYGIAQIAALQVWQRYRRDPHTAVEGYRHGLSLGGSRTLPELFEAAGVRFDLSAEMLASLVGDVESALG